MLAAVDALTTVGGMALNRLGIDESVLRGPSVVAGDRWAGAKGLVEPTAVQLAGQASCAQRTRGVRGARSWKSPRIHPGLLSGEHLGSC